MLTAPAFPDRLSMAAKEIVDCAIVRYTEQPRTECRHFFQLRKFIISMSQGFLNYVFSVDYRTDHSRAVPGRSGRNSARSSFSPGALSGFSVRSIDCSSDTTNEADRVWTLGNDFMLFSGILDGTVIASLVCGFSSTGTISGGKRVRCFSGRDAGGFGHPLDGRARKLNPR
jgi:hypothetical protein